jgi:hypothetical protein
MARRKIPPNDATTNEVANKLYLSDHRERFDGFFEAFEFLNTVIPGRTTCRQLLPFLAVVAANTRGERVTLTDLKGDSRETDDGARSIAAHMNKAYQMFLPPSVKDPEALGWLVQEPDLYDGRKKYLVLNDEGRRIALLLGETLEKAEPEVVDGYRIRRPSSERGEE